MSSTDCRGHAERAEDVLDRVQRRAAGEAGQRPQPALVVGEQQVVAPADRPGQRAAPLGAPAGRVAQQREPVVEPSGDVAAPTATAPGRRPARSPAAARRATGRPPRRRPRSSSSSTNWRAHLARPGRRTARPSRRSAAARAGRRSRRRDRAAPGWWRAPAAAARRRAGGRPGRPRRRRRARSCRAAGPSRRRRGGRRSICSPPVTCSVSATACGIDAAASTASSRTSQTPPGGVQAAGRPRWPSRVLPTPAGPTTVTSRWSRSEPIAGGELVGPPDQRCRRARAGCRPSAVARWAGRRRRRAPGSAAGSGPRAPRRSGPGSTPSSSTSSVPHPGVRRQRVGLPAGPVERGDQRRPQPLAQRVPLDETLELADHVAAGAEVDPRREVVLEQAEPDLLQPRPVGVQPVAVAGVDEHLAPEQRQRLGGDVQGGRRVAGTAAPRPPTRPGPTTCSASTHRLVDVQGVAAVAARDQAGSPSARRSWDTFDCRVLRPCGGRVAPQVLDEPVGAHRPPGVEREPDQHLGGLARRHGKRLAVAADLDRAEHGDGEHAASVCLVPTAGPVSRQLAVSAIVSARGRQSVVMPDDTTRLLRRLIGGDAAAAAEILDRAATEHVPGPARRRRAARRRPRRPARPGGRARHDDPGPPARRHRRRPPRRRRRPARRPRPRPPRRPPRQPPRRLDRRRHTRPAHPPPATPGATMHEPHDDPGTAPHCPSPRRTGPLDGDLRRLPARRVRRQADRRPGRQPRSPRSSAA